MPRYFLLLDGALILGGYIAYSYENYQELSHELRYHFSEQGVIGAEEQEVGFDHFTNWLSTNKPEYCSGTYRIREALFELDIPPTIKYASSSSLVDVLSRRRPHTLH